MLKNPKGAMWTEEKEEQESEEQGGLLLGKENFEVLEVDR